MQRDVAREGDEVVVAGDEVGVAVDLDEHADLAVRVDVGLDGALGGLAAADLGALRRGARAAARPPPRCRRRSRRGRLAVHHARAGAVAQLLHLRAVIVGVVLMTSRSPGSSARPSCPPSWPAACARASSASPSASAAGGVASAWLRRGRRGRLGRGLRRGGGLGVGRALGLRRRGLDGGGDLGLGGALVGRRPRRWWRLGGSASAAGAGSAAPAQPARRRGAAAAACGSRRPRPRRPAPGGRGAPPARRARPGARRPPRPPALALLLLAGGALLGLLAGLLLGLLAGALLLGPEHLAALRDDVADRLRDDRAGPDRVVVAGDHVVDPVRVAVRVDQADDRDPQALGLLDRDRPRS